MGDHGFVALDAVDLQFLAADQDCDIGSLLAGDRQLVHDLQLDVLRHAVLPELRAIDTSRLAFENLHIRCSNDFTINVGQHPRNLRMTQHGIHTPHLVSGAFGVVGCNDGLQQSTPIHGAGFVIGIHSRQEIALACFVHPQLQLGLIRIEPNSRRCIRAANAFATDIQPGLTRHVLGRYQAQRGAVVG